MATGTMTSLGMGSGLDLQGILDTRRKADEAILNLKKEKIKTQTAIKTQLNSVLNKLLSMKTNALSLSLPSNYNSRTVTESNKNIVTATALDGTKTGSHLIKVSRTASSSSFVSEGMSSASATVYTPTVMESVKGFGDTGIALAEGETIKIKYGTEDNPKTFSVTGTTGGMTAAALVAAINDSPANRDSKGNPLVSAATFKDDQGKNRIRISAASGGNGEENRVAVSGSDSVTGFAAPVSRFSFRMGKNGKAYEVPVPAETTLEDLAKRINEDKNNPGVKATVINTGNGDNPYQLILEAKASGEDSRITMIGKPPGLSMSEKNGSRYTMTGENPISFDTPVTINGNNNTILFQEDAGDGYSNTLRARIAPGEYRNGKELALAVEQALEKESSLSGNKKDYQVSINPDTGKMVINETGTLKNLTIKWGDAGSSASAVLGFSKNAVITPEASSLNSEVTIDGISYQRQDNKNQTDLIKGVTLSFYAAGEATISVESGTDTVKQNITSLIETYNTLITEIDENDDYDKEKDTWGPLSRSSAARTLKMDLKVLFNTKADPGGKSASLKDLGVELNRNGTITLDERKLGRELAKNFDKVQALFLGSGTKKGLADILNKKFGDYALSRGYLKGEIKTVDSRISRMEDHHKEGMRRLNKKYEIMAKEYANLGKYLAKLSSTQDYIKKMLPKSED
ncbi:MAG: flagellar filament capping protein FliD [Desulfobacterales bacterium]|nr:flagellar filament capping protein FliD [Desulfobacterales bacterium]